jgi:hypothetical protein
VDEIIGIISVDFNVANQLLITHFCSCEMLEQVGIQWGSNAALYRFKEIL